MRISLRELMLVVAVAAIGLAAMRFPAGNLQPLWQLATGVILLGSLLSILLDRGERQARAAGFLVCAVVYALMAQRADSGVFSQIEQNVRSASDSNLFPPTRLFLTIHQSAVGFHWVRVSDGTELDFDPAAPVEDESSSTAEALNDDAVRNKINGLTGTPNASFATGGRRGSPPTRGPTGGGSRSGGSRGNPPPRNYQAVNIADRMKTELSSTNLSNEVKNRALLRAILSNVAYDYRPRAPQQIVVAAGHCLFMLAVGYLGGHFATFVFQRRRLKQPTAVDVN